MANINDLSQARNADVQNPPLGPAVGAAESQSQTLPSRADLADLNPTLEATATGNIRDLPIAPGGTRTEITNQALDTGGESTSNSLLGGSTSASSVENPPLTTGAGSQDVVNPPIEARGRGGQESALSQPSRREIQNPALTDDIGSGEVLQTPPPPVSSMEIQNPPLTTGASGSESNHGTSERGGIDSAAEELSLRRELIVVVKRDAGLITTAEGGINAATADSGPLANLLSSEQATIRPLFGVSETRLRAEAGSLAAEIGAEIPDLSVYYRVEAPDERLDELANKLRQLEIVDGAYVKPPAEPAQMRLNNMAPSPMEAPAVTPDFTGRQGYLDAAPEGVDARYAWTVSGGGGQGVNVVDIEWGWRFTHEDLVQNQGGVISGTNSSDSNHGTAVLGEFSGDRNTIGITGISPDVTVRSVSLVTHNTAEAIRIAADNLTAGDIILLEVHRAGPQAGLGSGQFGFIAIEWWPDDFAAITYAVARGILVVEAAGNGGQNLDAAIYNTPQVGFPASWRNPFNPANPTSGAVLVGAGMPAPGTHGRNAHPGWGDVYADRGRCFFSNYGARVDAQGWGWEVTSTGYGDLQGGASQDLWYTDQFSGTSSASPIVVGTIACVQGVLRAAGKAPLTPACAIDLLRRTGSPQEDGPAFTFLPNMTGSGYPQNHPARPRTQRIGNRPDLRQLIPSALVSANLGSVYELLLSDSDLTAPVSLLNN